ncbi:pentapeptide repeat-containing protein [Microbacterium sp. NPDC090014]|uniref:pentapeptide repeat-containing protein n=1 Tax=Microbacterium sp. NPDC090014 TaxID=3364205 RepID=UPI003828E29D
MTVTERETPSAALWRGGRSQWGSDLRSGRAHLRGAHLRGAHLRGARGARPRGAHLRGAHLRGARGAHLRGARGAHLRGAHLRGARPRGARLQHPSSPARRLMRRRLRADSPSARPRSTRALLQRASR